MYGKAKFVVDMREKLGVTAAQAEKSFDTVMELIKEAAETDTVRLPGIGVIRKNIIPAHEAMNPSTAEKVQVPDRFNYRLSSSTQDI